METGDLSMDQRRAKGAWRCVEKGCSKEYVSHASGASALVMGNGLMQALAYYQNKRGEAEALGRDIRGWLFRGPEDQVGSLDFRTAMSKLMTCSPSDFLGFTEEALAYLKWLRQFAKATQKDG